MTTPVQRLRAFPALRDYADADLELLGRLALPRDFPKGSTLFAQGAPGSSCFLLLDGEVDVMRTHGDKVRVLATLRPGAIVGQIALVDRAPRSASVIAATKAEALELGVDVFDRLIESATPMALRFQEQIAVAGIRQLRAATERLAVLADQRAEANEYLYMQGALEEWDLDLADKTPAILELAADPRKR